MKTQTLSFSILFILSFMLMLAGSYVSSLQNWLVFSKSNKNVIVNQVVSYGSIRSISSSEIPKMAVGFVHLEENSGFDSNQSNAIPIVPESVKISSNASSTAPGHAEILLNPKNSELLASPTFIEYANELVLEFPATLASKENLKRAISKVLLGESEVDETNLLSLNSIKSQYEPFYYKKIRNQYGHAIRYPVEASAYAEYILKKHTSEIDDTGLKFTVVHIPLIGIKLPINVEKYKSWVEDYATRFKVSEDLVFAIIEVESAFNPSAVSKSNALGLMQLKAETAGRDVYQYVDGKKGQPGQDELFDAQNNIRMGTAYMGLLTHEYLQGVDNLEAKEMLSISSYNGGISNTLKLFGKTPEIAIMRVNQLHPKQVYRTLRYEHQSIEARLYLDKVLKAKNRYRDLLGLNA
ncbi:murein transglycosylase domain-containing protein [Thiomicrorhabdus arctica]|uniref:murein transglycosylase domain-containing protein n=1 Tax=Thiomicrorhabdus arctica TaxID=131540 RepID=UPI00037B8663|nr:murein transglycosylase domain-containing protein [Thiomicrorhabdus arctica]